MAVVGKHLTCWKGTILFLSRASGVVTDDSFTEEMAAIREIEECTHAPVHRIFDGRDVTAWNVTAPFMVARAINRRKTHARRAAFKCALIGTHLGIIEAAELLALIFEGSNIASKQFSCPKEVAKWIEIPTDFLENRLREL